METIEELKRKHLELWEKIKAKEEEENLFNVPTWLLVKTQWTKWFVINNWKQVLSYNKDDKVYNIYSKRYCNDISWKFKRIEFHQLQEWDIFILINTENLRNSFFKNRYYYLCTQNWFIFTSYDAKNINFQNQIKMRKMIKDMEYLVYKVI